MVNLAWPSWWSDEAEDSPSARAELRFALARKLGLDAEVLLQDDEPRFVWKIGTFKNLSGSASEAEKEAIISFATSLARVLLGSVHDVATAPDFSPATVRNLLLIHKPFVSLPGLLSFCWSIGVPVVQLHVLPLRAKRMCAMSVAIGGRYAILLARESQFPAQVAYYVAHELGHIALGHLSQSPALIDAEDPLSERDKNDPDETAADRYALEVLTGDAEPRVLTEARRYSAAALANAAMSAAGELQIDAGTLVLCFGHHTGRWDKVTAALRLIYPHAESVGVAINRYAMKQVEASVLISDENKDYLGSALGVTDA